MPGNNICNLPALLKILAGSFLVSLTIAASGQSRNKRPNILFIMTDDHAYQAISAYGKGLNHTPNIDRLAQNGMIFHRAFVTNSLCAPSRAAILTGKYGHLNGITGNDAEIFNGQQTTFPQLLQKAGYQTSLVGKWHLNSNPTGFDFWKILPGQGHYYNPDFVENGIPGKETGYVTNLITDYAIKWLEQRDTSKPFCLFAWQKAPHRNWMPPVKYLDLYAGITFPLPGNFYDNYDTRGRPAHEQRMQVDRDLTDNYDLKLNFKLHQTPGRLDLPWMSIWGRLSVREQDAFRKAYDPENMLFFNAALTGKALAEWKYQRFLKDYLRCVQSVDDNVQRMMEYLKANGLEENTIVIYTSDQGFYLGEHGWFDKRFIYDESFRTPLIIQWPGVIKPGSVNYDLVMNLDIGETLLDAAGINAPSDMQGKSLLPLLKGNKKSNWRDAVYYHYYENGEEHNVAKHIGIRNDSYTLVWFYEIGEWELYDLKNDPAQNNNVYNNSKYRKVTGRLKAALKTLAFQYNDKEVVTLLEKN